jgi:hypothetical protein
MMQGEKPAVVVAVMVIAAIYVITLIGVTHSSFFVGGAALERSARAPVVEANRFMLASEPAPPACVAPQIKVEEPPECVHAARTLRRLLGLQLD